MKRVIAYILTAFLVLGLAVALPGDYKLMKRFGFLSSRAFSLQSETLAGEAEAEELSKPVTTIESDLDLYKGDSTYIDIYYTDDDSVTVESQDPDIVKSTSKGRLTAIKSGKTTVFVEISGPERTFVLKIGVSVTNCSYDSVESRGTGLINRGDSPYVVLYRTCKKGYEGSVMASTDADGREFTYSSTNDSVVSVSEDGSFKALENGSANIIISEAGSAGEEKLMVCTVTVEDKKTPEVTTEDKDNWFKNSVIAGNSVTLGYDYHCGRQPEGYMGDIIHLSSSCYSILNDSKAITATSLHPAYEGVKRRISDHVRYLSPEKVFLNFGMNDLNIFGVEGAVDQYKAFIKEMHRAAPDSQIYILSMTPVMKNSGELTPVKITEFNRLMEVFAGKKSYVTFIDLYSGMVNESGYLKADYCSDGFCHLNDEAYKYWTKVLRGFAKKEIIRETKAQDAVRTALESGDAEDASYARELISDLSNAVLRSSLEARLD